MGLALSMVCFSPSIAKLTMWVWCIMNRWNCFLSVYRHLLTSHLHSKAAELCLANSSNISVTISLSITCAGEAIYSLSIVIASLSTL